MSREEINAFLGAGTVYQGKLTFQGAVRVDGVFSGEITSEGALIAGKDAVKPGWTSGNSFCPEPSPGRLPPSVASPYTRAAC